MTTNDRTPEPNLPTIDDLNRPFWDGCRAGELRLQICRACSHIRYPISEICPRCLSPEFAWRPMSGAGELLSWVVFHHGYQAAWAARLPYNVVLVQLPEGPRMFGNVEPLGHTDLAVGAAVHVVFVPASADSNLDTSAGAVLIPRWTLV
jgi:uncharacterized OB-fold protein